MTDTDISASTGALWFKRIGVVLLAIALIVGLFLASNVLTLAWQARENLRNQIRTDVRAAVAVIRAQPLGASQFTVVNAANDYAIGYDYTHLQNTSDANIVQIKHNQAIDRILILPLGDDLQDLKGSLDSGSTTKGYRVVGISLSNAVGGFAYTYDSKTAAYADSSFDANTLGSSSFDTSQATLIYSKQVDQARLTISTSATLGKDKPVRVPGASALDKLSLAAYTNKVARLTAFNLTGKQVALYDRAGKQVALPDAKWNATFIIANSPQESSIQFSTPVGQNLDLSQLTELDNGGQLRVNYRGLDMKLKFGERTFKQVFDNVKADASAN